MVKGKPLVRQGGRTLQGKIGNEDVEGLGTAASRDVGTSDSQVPEFVSNGEGLGGFGYGRVGTPVGRYADLNDVPKRTGFYLLTEGHPNSTNNKAPAAGFYDTCIMRTMRQYTNEFVDVYLPHPNYSPGMVIAPYNSNGYAPQRVVSDSLNLRTSTGNSTIYPMSQKAVTDALGTKVDSNDARLSDSREWTATTVSQEEAEAGTASTRRAWTAQRVRQAINAWWQLVTSGFGRNFIAATNEQAARDVLQLGTAATRDAVVGEMGITQGALVDTSWMGIAGYQATTLERLKDSRFSSSGGALQNGLVGNFLSTGVSRQSNNAGLLLIGESGNIGRAYLATNFSLQTSDINDIQFTELVSALNLMQSTGQSTDYPMTQKAVTDAINARGFADASGILTVTSGALSNDMSSFLSQTTKDTMRSNLGVPQLNASATQQGGLKARLDGTTLYLTNDGSDA